jgi:hypothetical protein
MKDTVHLGWKWPSQIKNRGLSGRWWRRRRPGGSSACRWRGSVGRSTWAGRWHRELIWGVRTKRCSPGVGSPQRCGSAERNRQWLAEGEVDGVCWRVDEQHGAGEELVASTAMVESDQRELSLMRCPQQRGNRRWGVSQGPSMAQLWRRTRAPMSAVGGEKASWEIVQRW